MSVLQILELNVPFLFRERPVDLPADLRPNWRIAVLLLLIKNCCRQNRTRFGRLHVLSWGIRSEGNRNALLRAVAGEYAPGSIIVRVEPSLNRAVDLAAGEKLLQRVQGDRVALLPAGVAFAASVEEVESLVATEKAFMKSLGRRVTEQLVSKVFTGRSI